MPDPTSNRAALIEALGHAICVADLKERIAATVDAIVAIVDGRVAELRAHEAEGGVTPAVVADMLRDDTTAPSEEGEGPTFADDNGAVWVDLGGVALPAATVERIWADDRRRIAELEAERDTLAKKYEQSQRDLEQARAALKSLETRARAKARQSSAYREASSDEHSRTVHSAQSLALWDFANEIAAARGTAPRLYSDRLDADREEDRAKCGMQQALRSTSAAYTAEFNAHHDTMHERDRLKSALEKIARCEVCGPTCTAYITAWHALGCPHEPPCPACTPAPSAADEEKPRRCATCGDDRTIPCRACGRTYRAACGHMVRTRERCPLCELPADAEAGKETKAT